MRKERLKLNVVARGTLESEENGNIYCTVKSGTKGSTNATTIRWLVDAGSVVRGPKWKREVLLGFTAAVVGLGVDPLSFNALTPGFNGFTPLGLIPYGKKRGEGEQIMELDSSGFQEQLKDKTKDVDGAYALKVQFDEAYKILLLDNETDIAKAINAYELAVIDEQKYQEGDFIQSKKDVEGRIETAKSEVDSWKDRSAWSERMFKKTLMSKVQADADKDRLKGAIIALGKVEEEYRVLVNFLKPRTLKDLAAKKAEAKLGIRKAELQAAAESGGRMRPIARPKTPCISKSWRATRY